MINKIFKPSSNKSHLLVVLALSVFTLIFYWKITQTLWGDVWPSDLMDGASFTWNLWYFPTQLFSGNNPFFTRDIFYPVGTSLGFHTYIPLLGLVASPIALIFGYPITYTVITLAGALVSGIGAYFLAWYLVRNHWIAMFAGVAYIILPDRIFRIGSHVNLNHTEMLPFGLLMILRFYDNPTTKNSIALGVVLGLSFLLEPVFTAFLLLATAVVVVLRFRTTFSRQYLLGWTKASGVAIGLSLPLLIPMMSEVINREVDPLPGWGGADSTSADLFSYVVPSGFHPIWGQRFWEIFANATAGERFTFAGWSVIALALVGIFVWKNHHKKILIALTFFFGILSFGPFLHVAGQRGSFFNYLDANFSIPLPYFIFHYIPILNGLRAPARFSFMVNLLLIVLATGTLAWILGRFAAHKQRWIAPVVSLSAIAVLTLECLPGNLPVMTSPKIPTPYDAIAKDPGNKAVLELPLQWRDGFGQIGDSIAWRDNTVFMYYAIHHGKPISGGMVARYSDKRQQQLENIAVYQQVLSLQGDRPQIPITFTQSDLQDLKIGYVVAHRDRQVPKAFEYVNSLGMPVMADDGNTIVWKVY